MAGTFLRFDFKLFLINCSIAVVFSAVLKLADAPNVAVWMNFQLKFSQMSLLHNQYISTILGFFDWLKDFHFPNF